MPRTCVFCGAAANSVEDALPLWITKELLPAGARVRIWANSKQGDGEPYLRTNTVGKRLERRVKRVCRTCNGGWMSKLELAAKPLLTPMFRGQAVVLDKRAQLTLARWAVKTATMMHYAAKTEHEIPDERLQIIKAGRTLPADTRVYMAPSQSALQMVEYEEKEFTVDGAAGAHGEEFSLRIGNLSLQVVSIVSPVEVSLHVAPLRVQPLEIWPRHQEFIDWPPPGFLLDVEFPAFMNRLTPTLPFPFSRVPPLRASA